MLLVDRKLQMREIMDTKGLFHGLVVSIMDYHLWMKKLYVGWLLGLFLFALKPNHVTASEEWFPLFNHNPDKLLHRSMTNGETWVSPGYSEPNKAKVVLSANKFKSTVFWTPFTYKREKQSVANIMPL